MLDTRTEQTCQTPTENDRRSGPRYPAEGTGHLTVVTATSSVQLNLKVVDVSRAGLQVEVDEPVKLGSHIKLLLGGATVLGIVGNCRQVSDDRYSLGILIREFACVKAN